MFVQRRIGETRAAIVEAGRLVEMHLRRDGDGAPPGTQAMARLKRNTGPQGIAVVETSGEEVILAPWPGGLSEGALVPVEIRRQAWREPGRDRLARARPIRAIHDPAAAIDDLAEELRRRGFSPRELWPDDIAVQWDEAWDAAELGRMTIPGGTLDFTPTPALVAVDVDGGGDNLAAHAAGAVARAVRLWGLGGIVVVDLPTRSREDRQAAAAAVDAGLAGLAFERTAVNGFGLLQLVLPRPGPSILERARLERPANAALRLLQAAVAETRPGALTIRARPMVALWLRQRPHLLAETARRAGRALDVTDDPMAGEGHVETRL